MEVVDDDSEEKVVGDVIDIHFGERYVSPITIHIYMFGLGSNSHWPEYQGPIGSYSQYTSLNENPPSAGMDFSGGYFGSGNSAGGSISDAYNSGSGNTVPYPIQTSWPEYQGSLGSFSH